MTRPKNVIIAAFVFGLVAGAGSMFQPSPTLAGGPSEKSADEMKQQATENVPENIQRSTPSGQEFPGSGRGPGSRGDQLTEMEEVEGVKNPTDPKKLLKEKGIAAESAKDKHTGGIKKDHQ